MPKQIVIAEQHRIAAVFAEDRVQEIIVSTGNHQVGDVYLGVVENVLPGIDAAFVNIGDPEINGFIHVSDLGPLRLKRSAGAITELLTPQQKVLVQVMKEPTGTKGPRLTGNCSLPGRYLVLMPYGRGVNLSRRIRSESERSRLRALAILIKPAGMGMLVRTEAEGVDEEAILEDLKILQKQWEVIQQEASSTKPPALLKRDDDFIHRVLREVYSADVNRIVADSHIGVKRIKEYLMNWNQGRTPQGVLIDHHRDRAPILEYFRINAAIREALKPRVELPSGGYIVIEPTEALTVIDVNSGSFTRSATSRETVLWTNCEAATEIARQLRLRNLAGVIIVDFIDMDSRPDRQQVIEHFHKALKADKARPQIVQLSELGLVELTRKRQGQNLYELFSRPCSTCGGLGHLVHLPGEAETMVEPPPRQIEPRTITVGERTPAPPVERIEAPIAETPEPELRINNNKEVTTLPNNRRRRRRLEDLILRDDEGTRTSEPEYTPEVTAYNDASEDEEEVQERFSYGSSRENRDRGDRDRERPDRDRGGRGRGDRGAPEPPEVISVEMTPEEQEVYAMMGISPLVLADRPVKNPRSAVISIRTPGEVESAGEPAPDSAPEPSNGEAEISTLPDTSDDLAPIVEAMAVEAVSEEDFSEDMEANDETEPNGAEDKRRRRRRRSSVAETNGG